MSAPLAVDTTNPRPGLYVTVDLLRGETSPGAALLRGLIISPPAVAVGDIVVGTEIRPVYSADDVRTAVGRAPAFYAFQSLVKNDPSALIDLVACAASGGNAATATLTFAGTVTADETWDCVIAGVHIQLSRAVGDSADTAKTAAIAAINAYVDSVPVVASSGGVGVVTLTVNYKGPTGNDVTTRVARLAGAGGTLAFGAARCTGGTTEYDITTALATVAGREYDYILICVSNADAASASTSNPSRLVDHIQAYQTGSSARLQQGYVGLTDSIASAQTGAIAHNAPELTYVLCVNAESLPFQLAAADMGDRMKRRRRESNANRVLTPLKGIFGSADVVADAPTDAESTTALRNGVSLCGYNAQGDVILLRSVTTHSQDSSGNPDTRCFDTNEVDAIYDYAKDLRAFLPQEFLTPGSQVKVAKDRVEGDDELPAGVVEERDIKAAIVRRTLGFWVPKGAIDGAAFQAAIDGGTLIVEVNAADPTQVDIFVPAVAVKILAKMGLYIGKVG